MRMCQEFGSAGAGAVYSLGFQNQRVHIVLEASKSAGAKGDVSKSCHTVQNSQNKWTKISDLETDIFELKVG